MSSGAPYAVRYAPIAEMQIDAALLWWRGNRELAPGLLARELDAERSASSRTSRRPVAECASAASLKLAETDTAGWRFFADRPSSFR